MSFKIDCAFNVKCIKYLEWKYVNQFRYVHVLDMCTFFYVHTNNAITYVGESVHEALLITMETKQEEEMDMLLALLDLARADSTAAGYTEEVLYRSLKYQIQEKNMGLVFLVGFSALH
mgnify:CR=1 FL=1